MVDLGGCGLDDGHVIALDLCVSDCGMGNPPVFYRSGAKCEAKGREKKRKYQQRFPAISLDELCCPSYGRTGSMNREAVVLQKRIINALAAADTTVHRSLVAGRVNQCIAVAIQRAVAFNILEYRYTTLPMGRAAARAAQAAAPVQAGGDDWENDAVNVADPQAAGVVGAAGPVPVPAGPGGVVAEGVQ